MADGNAGHDPRAEGVEDLLADGWQFGRPGPFAGLVGPMLRREREGRLQFCFRVAPKHDNTHGRAHGGMIMSFLDEALGYTAHHARPGEHFFTIGFDCQFVGGSKVGDLVIADTFITRSTRSLVFTRAECLVDGEIIAAASGIWKAISPRRSPA